MTGNHDKTDVLAILNRLLVLHHRSLPAYLGWAQPWRKPGQQRAHETLQQIVQDQARTVDRLGSMILQGRGELEYGEFPIQFTGLNDLSFDYLLGRMITHQREMIAEINDLVSQLACDPLAQALAQECLGQAKAHLESLEELAAEGSDDGGAPPGERRASAAS